MGTAGETAGESPAVFISWAHRNSAMTGEQEDSWRDLVRALAEKLTDSDIEVRLDLYERGNVDWTRWGPRMTQECDFTLIVASTAWRERWEGRNEPQEGAGAVREADALHGMFDKNQRDFHRRVLIVMLPGTTEGEIPADLYGIVRFKVNPPLSDSMEPLLRHLLDKPKFVLPARGARPELPPQQRVTPETPAGSPAEKAASPPELRPGEKIEDWMTSLAAWNDDTAVLVDDIDLATALASRDVSARFVQQRDKARESIQVIIAGLRGPRTAGYAAGLSETAARLRGQVAQLARLAQEP